MEQASHRQVSLTAVVQDASDFWGDATFSHLSCPNCGSEFQHLGEPVTIAGNDNYEAKWGGRGDLVAVPIEGECGSRWEICFGFHKGNTATFARITKSCQKDLDTFVYFIEAVGIDRIKIGVSRDPEARVQQLSTGSPFPLNLLGKLRGGPELERQLQHQFAALHITGEWFHASQELRAFLRQGGSLTSS